MTNKPEPNFIGISLRGVSIAIGGKRLFKDLELTVQRGQNVAITGPSGCGKSSLLSAILGFIPLETGTISINGFNVCSSEISSVRKCIAWLPQTPVPGAHTVRDALSFPLTFRANASAREHAGPDAANAILTVLGLDHLAPDAPTQQLSGGEKQRLSIAVASLLQRPVWLADEPTASLDKQSKQAAIAAMLGDPHRAILTASHDRELLDACDRVIDLSL